jgi:hypothetical protein
MLSMVTPRLLTLSDTGIDVEPSKTSWTTPSIRCRALLPMTIASNLSGFSDKPFKMMNCLKTAVYVHLSIDTTERDV